MLYLCLTADYELFFGKNLLPEKDVLFLPTLKLLDIAKANNAVVTLMADVLSVFRYREYGLSEYPLAFEEQIRYAVSQGHDVQLHLHPHWLSSTYMTGTTCTTGSTCTADATCTTGSTCTAGFTQSTGSICTTGSTCTAGSAHPTGSWKFDENCFKLHDLSFDGSDMSRFSVDNVIRRSIAYLEDLIRPVNNSYKCIGFRAGGWCIQPEREILKRLKAYGINIDSTVYKNGCLKSKTHYFDFRNIPEDSSYWVDPDKGFNSISECDGGNIFEVCIGSFDRKPIMYCMKLKNKLLQKRIGNKNREIRGMPIGYDRAANVDRPGKVIRKLSGFINNPIMLSLENNDIYTLKKIIDYYIKKSEKSSGDIYVSIITHPKSLYDAEFERLYELLRFVDQKKSVRFITLSDINREKFE